MIVGIVRNGSGLIAVEEFRSGNDVASALAAFCSQHSPPLDPADYFAFDTGWFPSDQKLQREWAFDFSLSTMAEIDRWRGELTADVLAHRDVKLSTTVLAEFPTGSGQMFGCSIADQNELCKLAVLDRMGMVPYPFAIHSHDRSSTHDLTAAELPHFTAAISGAVLSERLRAEITLALILMAPDEAAAQAAADVYMAT